MRIHVRYCNICQKKIPDLEWETGDAMEWENFFYCGEHAEQGKVIIDRMVREREEKARKREEQDALDWEREDDEARAKAREEHDQRIQRLSKAAPKRSPLASRYGPPPQQRGKGQRTKPSGQERRPISKRTRDLDAEGKDARTSSKKTKGSRVFGRKAGPSDRIPSGADLEIRPLTEEDLKSPEAPGKKESGSRRAAGSDTSTGTKGYSPPKRSASKRLRATRSQTSRRKAASGPQSISGRHLARKRQRLVLTISAAATVLVIGLIVILVFILTKEPPEPAPRRGSPDRPEPTRTIPDPDVTQKEFDISNFVFRVQSWTGDEDAYNKMDADIRKAGEAADPKDEETREAIGRAFDQLQERRETLAEQEFGALEIEIEGMTLSGNSEGIRVRLDSYTNVFRESIFGGEKFSPYLAKIEALLSEVEKLDAINLPDDLSTMDEQSLVDIVKTLDEFEFPEDSAWKKRVQDAKSAVDAELTRRMDEVEQEKQKRRRGELAGIMGGVKALIVTGRHERAIAILKAFAVEYPGTPEAAEAQAKINKIRAEQEAEYLTRFFTGNDLGGWTIEKGLSFSAADGVVNLKSDAANGTDIGIFKGKDYWEDYELTFSFMRKSAPFYLFLRADDKKNSERGDAVEFAGPPFKEGVWFEVKVRLSGNILEVTTSLDGAPHRVRIKAESGGIGFRVAPGGQVSIKGIKVSMPK
ncbi:MAG: LamG domain-containing protein [Planctomycetota bacterium]